MRASLSATILRGRKIVLRLPRWRADKPSPEESAVLAPADSPTAYRTFSPKIAPSFTALGGAAAALGGLGQWIRVTVVPAEGLSPQETMSMAGIEDPFGRLIAGLGLTALVASALWLGSTFLFRLVPAVAAFAAAGLIAWRTPELGERITALTADARSGAQLDFVAFHAGLGWGAWLLVIAALMLFLGAVVGLLRELDLRRGFAS